jgi:hypothetical protein
MESPYAYFRITEKAGRFVAGRNNTGAGTQLLLSRREAAYEVSLGTLVEVGAKAEAGALVGGTGSDTLDGGDGDGTGGAVSEDGDISLAKMTVKELRALAENSGVEIEDRATKAEIIAAIEASSG